MFARCNIAIATAFRVVGDADPYVGAGFYSARQCGGYDNAPRANTVRPYTYNKEALP